jgi:Stabilization of polarity axis
MQTVGFIAGVTNPMFLERDQWWDLACVMDLIGSGAVYSPDEKRKADEHSKGGSMASTASSSSSSSRGGHILGGNILANVGGRLLPFENPDVTQQHLQDSNDSRFVTGVLSVITTKAFKSALNEEEWVARRFYDYSSHVIDIARDPHLFFTSGIRVNNNKLNDFDNSIDRVKRSNPEGMTTRTAALRSNPEFLLIPSSPWVWANLDVNSTADKYSESISDDGDAGELQGNHLLPSLQVASFAPFDADYYSLLRAQVRSLQHSAHSVRTETPTLFSDLLRVLVSESSTQAMLSLLPLSLGGLDTIGMGLLHPNPSVRLNAVGIIKKVKQFPSTRGTVDTMNGLLLFAFERQVKLCDSGELDHLIAAYDRRLVLALPEEKSTVKVSYGAVVSSPSPRLFGTSKSRVGPLPISLATSPNSSCPDSALSPAPPSQSGNGLDNLPSSFMSFASAASGMLTGMLTNEEVGPESDNVTTRRGFNQLHEEEREHDLQSIELIHY